MPGLIDQETQEAVAQVDELEELWHLESAPPAARRPVLGAFADRLGWFLAAGWILFIVSVFFEPAPDPNAVVPPWGEVLILSFWLGLAAAGILALARAGRGAYLAATIAGGLGIVLAITCRTSEHHLGSWWIYEMGATGALTALGAALLLRSKRR